MSHENSPLLSAETTVWLKKYVGPAPISATPLYRFDSGKP
jgi:hypothetical protein